MQRYFLEENNLSLQDKHHIKKVMRMQTGDQVIVCFNHVCHVVKLKVSEDVTYEIVETLETVKRPHITLYQGLPKALKIETTIKYAAMFGVSSIVITEMVRSIAKLPHVINKTERFKAIAKEASELAHRADVPNISYAKSIKEILKEIYDVVILADEDERRLTLDDLSLQNINQLKIAVIIGPEGGISDTERSFLKENHAKIISLGKNILASEIASVAILNYFLTK